MSSPRTQAQPQSAPVKQTSIAPTGSAAPIDSAMYPIWHPFTQAQTAPPPLEVVSGSGSYLTLADGRKILDCISSWWVNLHGHSHPDIARAIYEQAQKLEHVIFAGFTHQPAMALSQALLSELPPHFFRVFFSDNGSTAVEVALKMAFQYWRNHGCTTRNAFIAFDGGYHGDTVGAMSAGRGSPFWNHFNPLLFHVDTVSYPETFDADKDVEVREAQALLQLAELIDKNPLGYAGIIIEPLVQGAAGMRMCRPEFLQALQKFARANQLLLIYDEVMTGFGRTGDLFACAKSSTQPDIITLSKGITGGFLPLSVTICTENIYNAFLSSTGDRTFYHGHSYTANPLACAAALASHKLLHENQSAFRNMEAEHRRLAEQYLSGSKHLERLRYCGTIFAADVVTGDATNYFNEVGPELRKRFLAAGFLIRPLGNTIYLMPPYCTSTDELASIYQTIRTVVDSL